MAAAAEFAKSPTVNRILTGYFRESAGYRIRRPHGTQDWLLIFTAAGSGQFRWNATAKGSEDRIVTSPGDVVLIRPNTAHDYGVDPSANRWNLIWAHFHPRPEWHPWLAWPAVSAAPPGLMRLSLSNPLERRTVERALRKMNDVAVGPHRLSKTFAINALEEALLWCAEGVLRPASYDPRVEQAEDYLCRHLGDNVTLDDLAQAVGLSVSRLTHLFKNGTGITPQRYYETRRLERARQMLEFTGLPIKSIAAEIGFENPFYFTQRFKRFTGKSPRAYRRSLA